MPRIARLPALPRPLIVGLAAVLLAALGCDDGTAPIDRDLPDPDAEHGVVEAFAFRDATAPGGLRLHRTAEDGTGLEPAADAEVTVVGEGVSGTAGPDGHFRVGPLTPGLYDAVISDGENQRQIAVTVTADAVINVGETPVARAEAADLVLAETGLTDSLNLWLLGPQQPLPEGTVIGQALSTEDGAAVEFALDAPAWVFYLDDNPVGRFHKTVRFLLVDPESGDVTTRQATSWPTFNGYMFYGNLELNRTSPDLVRAPDWEVGTTAAAVGTLDSAPWSTTAAPRFGELEGQTFGLIIEGDAREDFGIDTETTTKLVEEDLGGTVFPYNPPAPGQVQDPVADILGFWDQICANAGPDDTVFLGFHTHGTSTGNLEITSQRYSDGTRGGYARWHPALDLTWEDCNAGRIIIWADVCYSGKLVQRMEQYVEDNPEIFGGKEVILLASSAVDELSGGADTAYAAKHGVEIGGYFTTPMRAELGDLSAGLSSEELVAAFERAKPIVTEQTSAEGRQFNAWGSQGMGQHPESYERQLVPGETLHPDGTVTQWGVQLDLGNGLENVPLARIEGYVIADPHTPVTEEFGCEYTHLHAASEEGITVTLEDGSQVGPIADPAPSFCGYGRILDIPFP